MRLLFCRDNFHFLERKTRNNSKWNFVFFFLPRVTLNVWFQNELFECNNTTNSRFIISWTKKKKNTKINTFSPFRCLTTENNPRIYYATRAWLLAAQHSFTEKRTKNKIIFYLVGKGVAKHFVRGSNVLMCVNVKMCARVAVFVCRFCKTISPPAIKFAQALRMK